MTKKMKENAMPQSSNVSADDMEVSQQGKKSLEMTAWQQQGAGIITVSLGLKHRGNLTWWLGTQVNYSSIVVWLLIKHWLSIIYHSLLACKRQKRHTLKADGNAVRTERILYYIKKIHPLHMVPFCQNWSGYKTPNLSILIGSKM